MCDLLCCYEIDGQPDSQNRNIELVSQYAVLHVLFYVFISVSLFTHCICIVYIILSNTQCYARLRLYNVAWSKLE